MCMSPQNVYVEILKSGVMGSAVGPWEGACTRRVMPCEQDRALLKEAPGGFLDPSTACKHSVKVLAVNQEGAPWPGTFSLQNREEYISVVWKLSGL